MKAEIIKIKRNWRPNLFGSTFSNIENDEMMENGFYSGSLWEKAIIKEFGKRGWITTEPNNNSDAIVFDLYNESDVEIRIVSKNGFIACQANVSGSKGTKENKIKSVKEKIKLLGEAGTFCLIDITKSSAEGASVYLFSTKNYTTYFGEKKFHVSYPEFQRLIKNRLVDKTD
jgi:hypothetical protein